MNFVQNKEISKLSKTINKDYVIELTYVLEDINRIIFDNALTLENIKKYLLENDLHTYVFYYEKQRNRIIFEKEHFNYFTFMIKVTDPDHIKKLIQTKNDQERIFGDSFVTKTFNHNNDFYLKFRLSMNSSYERHNFTLVEKIYLLDFNQLRKKFE